MRNFKVTLEYDGTHFSGWQIQNKGKHSEATVQGELEKSLKQLFGETIKAIGSGRTDSGVHALGQVANFKIATSLTASRIQGALNATLPRDIRIKKIQTVRANFHARFCAKKKHYQYKIVNAEFISPFSSSYAHLVRCALDLTKMRKAAQHLKGRHDFRSFQAKDKFERSSIRTITRLSIKKVKNLIIIDIAGNGFLYKMVRTIVGTLIEVGRGKCEADKVKQILRAKNRTFGGPCAPARGLHLIKVSY